MVLFDESFADQGKFIRDWIGPRDVNGRDSWSSVPTIGRVIASV